MKQSREPSNVLLCNLLMNNLHSPRPADALSYRRWRCRRFRIRLPEITGNRLAPGLIQGKLVHHFRTCLFVPECCGPKPIHDMPQEILTAAQVADFHRDGFIIVRGLFDAEEMNILRTAAKADAALKSNAYEVADGKGTAIKLALGTRPARTFTAWSPAARAYAMEQLLGDEVYHYHSKMSIKGAIRGRRVELASGLRLLVFERLPLSRHGQRLPRR